MSNKLNHEGALLFEQPFAKVPYETYRKIFRISQRHIERECTGVQNLAKELTTRSKSRSLSTEDAVAVIDNMIGRVENLKRKLSKLQEEGAHPVQEVMRERINHIAAIEKMQTTNTSEYDRWADTRLDRWLVDWCLRNGKEATAKKIAKQKEIENLVDIDLFMEIQRIEDALRNHSCTEALSWCAENKTTLKKIKSTLEFDLRLQEFIELSRLGKKFEAIAYMRKHLLPWQETHLAQIEQASALLAVLPSSTASHYKRLWDASRWESLIASFRSVVYTLYSLPAQPLLHLSLYSGLASLKSPACYNEHTKNVDCPVCDGGTNPKSHSQSNSDGDDDSDTESENLGLAKLAEEVPWAHHANSTIVCRITGKIMDADNMPMAFPGGNVYSKEAMEEMAARRGGTVVCPRTGEECKFSELRKVFFP